VEIEDPFGSDDNDLPLERICATIEANLRGLLDALPPDGKRLDSAAVEDVLAGERE
jgi:predicted membrane chloride channel (bestrophin family)